MNQRENVFVNVCSNLQTPTAANSSTRSRKKGYKAALFRIGIVEMVIGAVCVIFGALSMGVPLSNTRGYTSYSDYSYYLRIYKKMTYAGIGIWCGVFAIVVGTLGMKARRNPNRCMYKVNVALSIIGTSVMGGLALVTGIVARQTNDNYLTKNESYRFPGFSALSILPIVGVVGMIIMIIHFVYCCVAICRKSNRGVRVFYQSHIGMQQTQLILSGNDQYVSDQRIVAAYTTPQVPVAGEPMVIHQVPQLSQDMISTQVPETQCFKDAGLQSQVPTSSNSTAIETVGTVAQPTSTSNPWEIDQERRKENEGKNPAEYNSLPRNEQTNTSQDDTFLLNSTV